MLGKTEKCPQGVCVGLDRGAAARMPGPEKGRTQSPIDGGDRDFGQSAALASSSTAGARYRGHRLVATDGSILSVPDEEANRRHLGLLDASRGQAGSPKLRLSALMEFGTRAPLTWCRGPWSELEMEQAERLVPHLEPGMGLLADRYYSHCPSWSAAQDRGADLLWQVRSNQAFPARGSFPDGF